MQALQGRMALSKDLLERCESHVVWEMSWGWGDGKGGGKVLLSYLFRHGRLLPTFVSLPQVCQVSDNWH